MRQRTQKPLSARINYNVLQDLDEFCYIEGVPRNMVINRAIKEYLELLDIMHKCSVYRSDFIENSDFLALVRKIDQRRHSWFHI